MGKILSVGALLACAGSPCAAQFGVRIVGTDSPGGPIVLTGNVYQSGSTGNLGGPTPNAIDFNPNIAYDSYVAINPGPSTGGDPLVKNDGFHANPDDLLVLGPGLFTNPNTVEATWFRDPEGASPTMMSVPNSIFGGAHAIFVGRFSFRTTDGSPPAGSVSLSVRGTWIDIQDPATVNSGPTNSDTLFTPFFAFNEAVTSGQDPIDLTFYPLAYAYQLRLHTFEAQVGVNRYLVNDMYIVQVPSPGTSVMALFSALGLGRPAFRRRRM